MAIVGAVHLAEGLWLRLDLKAAPAWRRVLGQGKGSGDRLIGSSCPALLQAQSLEGHNVSEERGSLWATSETALAQPYFLHIPYREMKLIFTVYFLCVLLECKLREKRDFLFLAYLCIFSTLYKNEYLSTKRMYNKQKNKLSQFMSLLLTSPN